jgi:hypothetical protein
MHVLVEALFENAAAEVIRLPFYDLTDCLAQLGIGDARLARRLGEPGALETRAGSVAALMR